MDVEMNTIENILCFTMLIASYVAMYAFVVFLASSAALAIFYALTK